MSVSRICVSSLDTGREDRHAGLIDSHVHISGRKGLRRCMESSENLNRKIVLRSDQAPAANMYVLFMAVFLIITTRYGPRISILNCR